MEIITALLVALLVLLIVLDLFGLLARISQFTKNIILLVIAVALLIVLVVYPWVMGGAASTVTTP